MTSTTPGTANLTDTLTLEQHAEKLKRDGIRYIRFEMSDLMGLPRSKTVAVDSFAGFARKGVNMYGGALGLDTNSDVVPNTGLSEECGYMDAFLIPDLNTLRPIPWEPHSASVICTPHWTTKRTPLAQSPRNVLQTQLDKARDMGFSVTSGHELEFYLYDAETREHLFEGHHIFASGRNHYSTFICDLMDQLSAMGLALTTYNAEYAPSQFEINFAPAEGIACADDAFRFKAVVKEFARKNGLLATFMTKPRAGIAGNGYHLHIGLNDAATGENAFNDADGPEGLSQTALQFSAGILDHIQGAAALIAPTINCYHRFLRGSFAPSRVTWGIEDRTALLRMKAAGDKSTHVEMRGGAGMANPYLLQAAILAAGLMGIERGKAAPMPKPGLAENDETAPFLPQSLNDALTRLEEDQPLCDALGQPFIHLFTTVKRHEIDRCMRHISDWETNEYLELY